MKWWDSRRVIIFGAFAPKNAPKMNLAKVIHAGWSNRDSPNLSLLDAAQIDAKDSILLAAELKAIEKGSSIAFGQGPSFQEKRARSHYQEVARAVEFGKDIVSLSDFQIDPNSAHRPPTAKKTKQCSRKDTKKKTEQRSSQNPSTSTQDFLTPPTQQPSTSSPLPVTQQQTETINVTDKQDQSQLNQISVASSTRGLPQFGTVPIADPSGRLSAPGPSNQYLLPGPSHFQQQQQVLFSSTLDNLQTSTAATHNPDISHQPLSQRQPEGIHTHYGLATPCVSKQARSGGSWHSGHSPYRYELVELPSKVRKCYGCGVEFSEKFRQPPYNFVVKHVDRRLVRRDERTGQFHYSADIARKNPVFDGNVYLSMVTYQTLDARQYHVISTSNVNVLLV